MDRAWIEYESGPERPISGMYVTLNHRGDLVYSRHVYEALGRAETFILLFDPKTDTIGVKPCSQYAANAFPGKVKSQAQTRYIYIRPFCVKHDIRIEGTVRFRTAAVEDGILVLSLRDLVIVRKGTPGMRRGPIWKGR